MKSTEKVYVYDNFKNDMCLIDKWRPLLSAMRKNKVDSYKFNKDKLLSVTAYTLFRYALFCEYNSTNMPEFVIDKNGKPFIKNSMVEFNLSHSNDVVLCGIGDYAIGVDVQDYSESVTDIKDKIFTEKEIKNCTDEKKLLRLWTLKEAYGKYKGFGICYDYQNTDFSSIVSSDSVQSHEGLKYYSQECENYAFSACSDDNMCIIKVTKTQLHDFANNLLSQYYMFN